MGIRGLNNLLLKYNCIQNYDKIPNNIRTIAIDANLYIKFFYILNTICVLYDTNCIEVLKKVFNLCLPVKRLVAIITRENTLNFSSFY